MESMVSAQADKQVVAISLMALYGGLTNGILTSRCEYSWIGVSRRSIWQPSVEDASQGRIPILRLLHQAR